MSETRKKAGAWPLLVVVIGVSFLGVTGWSIYRAATGTSRITDPEYFSHGLKYNQTRIEERAAESLGWRLTSDLDEGRLLFTLQTEDAEPVSGCRGEVLIFDRDNRLSLPVHEEKAGYYYAELPAELSGSLTGDLLLQRDGARISRRLLINLNGQLKSRSAALHPKGTSYGA
jgi:hypothetical protein